MDALLAAADGRGEGGGGEGAAELAEREWGGGMSESEAKELLEECLKRVLLLEEVRFSQ